MPAQWGRVSLLALGPTCTYYSPSLSIGPLIWIWLLGHLKACILSRVSSSPPSSSLPQEELWLVKIWDPDREYTLKAEARFPSSPLISRVQQSGPFFLFLGHWPSQAGSGILASSVSASLPGGRSMRIQWMKSEGPDLVYLGGHMCHSRCLTALEVGSLRSKRQRQRGRDRDREGGTEIEREGRREGSLIPSWRPHCSDLI